MSIAETDELLLAEGLRPGRADGDARLLGARDARRRHEGPMQVAAQERAHGRVQGACDVVRPERDGSSRDGVGVVRHVERVSRERRGLDGMRSGIAGDLQCSVAGAWSTGTRRSATPDGFFAQLEFLPAESAVRPDRGESSTSGPLPRPNRGC